MIDKTTQGMAVEPEEVQAVLQSLCGYHLAERDAAYRYSVLTREQVLYEALVQAIRRERGRALADLVAAGHTATQVGAMTNLGSRQRVARLIALASNTTAPAPSAPSADFDEKFAAVEATLDEVVRGLLPVVDTPPPIPGQRRGFDDVTVFDDITMDQPRSRRGRDSGAA